MDGWLPNSKLSKLALAAMDAVDGPQVGDRLKRKHRQEGEPGNGKEERAGKDGKKPRICQHQSKQMPPYAMWCMQWKCTKCGWEKWILAEPAW